MRIGPQHAGRIVYLHLFKKRAGAGVGISAAPAQDIDKAVGDLGADTARGVEGCQRVLRDKGAGGTDQAAALGRGQGQQIGACKGDGACDNLYRLRQDAQNGLADHGFAGSAFADKAAHFARRHFQRNRPQQAVRRALDAQGKVADGKKAHLSTGS